MSNYFKDYGCFQELKYARYTILADEKQKKVFGRVVSPELSKAFIVTLNNFTS